MSDCNCGHCDEEHHTCNWQSWCAMCEYLKARAVVEAAKNLDAHMMRFKEDVPLGFAYLGVLLNAALRDLEADDE